MYLNSYKYETGVASNGRVEITVDRDMYLSQGLGRMLNEWLGTLEVGSKVAVLYAAGPAIHHSDSRKIKGTGKDGTVVVKSQVGFSVYELLRMCKFEVDFVSINANTCASSMYSLYEADRLLRDGYSDVVVISLDLVDDTQELLFKQLGVDLVCGDGVLGMHLSNRSSDIEIDKVVWKWNRDSSPMAVSSEGYKKVLMEIGKVDIVKMHGSGTERNTQEEAAAIEELVGDVKCVEYKSEIGHTQGASSGIELCMLVDREQEWETATVLASGLGGFYGGCRVRRNNGDKETRV